MGADLNGGGQGGSGSPPSPVRSRPADSPRPLRDGIAALQTDRCFYCRGPLGARPEADHFIPRVRCGVDAVENLVLAYRACNTDRRDLLPGPPRGQLGAPQRTPRRQASRARQSQPVGQLTPRRPRPWPARSTATCPRAAHRSGLGSETSAARTPLRSWPFCIVAGEQRVRRDRPDPDNLRAGLGSHSGRAIPSG
jgi:hypothetical protein